MNQFTGRSEYRKTTLFAVRRFAKAERRLLFAVAAALGIDRFLAWASSKLAKDGER